MSRTIKFRIWNPEKKEMFESGGTPTMLSNFFLLSAKMHTYHRMEYQQFTGLKDRNGKEIYEGDILRFDPKEWGGDTGNLSVVEFSTSNGWQAAGTTSDWSSWCDVVGNIHENPELLTKWPTAPESPMTFGVRPYPPP